jgi:hypothetical protein
LEKKIPLDYYIQKEKGKGQSPVLVERKVAVPPLCNHKYLFRDLAPALASSICGRERRIGGGEEFFNLN